MDIYERSGTSVDTYFDEGLPNWARVTSNLSCHGITMRMITVHDAGFERMRYPYGIKAHIRYEMTEHAKPQLAPVQNSRGVNFR